MSLAANPTSKTDRKACAQNGTEPTAVRTGQQCHVDTLAPLALGQLRAPDGGLQRGGHVDPRGRAPRAEVRRPAGHDEVAGREVGAGAVEDLTQEARIGSGPDRRAGLGRPLRRGEPHSVPDQHRAALSRTAPRHPSPDHGPARLLAPAGRRQAGVRPESGRGPQRACSRCSASHKARCTLPPPGRSNGRP